MEAMTASNVETALRWAGLGAKVFPCHPNKTPLVMWQELATTDEDTIRDWWAKHPFAIPAISTDNLLVIDADRKSGIDGVAVFAEFCTTERIGTSGAMRVRTPSGGEHFIFRTEEATGIGNKTGRLPKGVNVRSDGEDYIITPGTLRDDGSKYEVIAGPSPETMLGLDEIGLAPEPLLSALAQPRPAQAGHFAQPSLGVSHSREERLEDIDLSGIDLSATTGTIINDVDRKRAIGLLARIAEDVALSPEGARSDTLNIAVFSAGRDVASKLLDANEVEATLMEASHKNGLIASDGEAAARKTIKSGIEGGIRKLPPPVGADPARGTMGAPTAASQAGAFLRSKLWWHGDPSPYGELTWLAKGMIPAGTVGLVAGQSGAGKTFVTLDLAAAVMTGEPFAGRKVETRGGVLFIAAEGAFEIPKRLNALVEERVRPLGLADVNPDALPFTMLDTCPALLRDGRMNEHSIGVLIETICAAAAAMEEKYSLPLTMIVIDTVAACAGFTDENDAGQAQSLFNALRMLASASGATVVGVDHFGKAVETGTRGSSAKEAAADFVLAVLAEKTVTGKTSNRRLSVRKLRGGEQGIETAFDMRTVTIGHDKDGEPVTTLVVDWASQASSAPMRTTRGLKPSLAVRLLLDCVSFVGCDSSATKNLTLGAGGPTVIGVDRERIREVFFQRYAADGQTMQQRDNAKRAAFKRATDQAQVKKMIGVRDEGATTWIWLV
jgi:RecA/RadA recombinase